MGTGPDVAAELGEGGSSRQMVTEQREELREAVLREALLRHPDQTARPTIAYPQLDKTSTAWKLGLPGPTTGLTTPVFKEVMAMHLFLPSIACKEVVGQRVGARRAVAGPFGDELMCAQLPGDSWRWRHDEVKLCLMNICNDSKIRADAEVFGLFRDLIPPELVQQGGELQYGRQRVGLTPDLLLRMPTPDGVTDQLGYVRRGQSLPTRGRRKASRQEGKGAAGNISSSTATLGPGGQGDRSGGKGSLGEAAREVWRASLLGGRSLGGLFYSPASADCYMRREQGGTSLSVHWPS